MSDFTDVREQAARGEAIGADVALGLITEYEQLLMGRTDAREDVAVGEVCPTPIMRWMWERMGLRRRFFQSVMLEVPAGVGEEALVAAVQAVLDRHDVLRLQVRPGTGQLEVRAPGAVEARTCVRRVVVAGLDEAARRACLQAE